MAGLQFATHPPPAGVGAGVDGVLAEVGAGVAGVGGDGGAVPNKCAMLSNLELRRPKAISTAQ